VAEKKNRTSEIASEMTEILVGHLEDTAQRKKEKNQSLPRSDQPWRETRSCSSQSRINFSYPAEVSSYPSLRSVDLNFGRVRSC